jgi:YidC/Oxa1 family membrane protein insertase
MFPVNDAVLFNSVWVEFVLFRFQYITIGIMLVIKNYIVDDEKIHAQIQENKKKKQETRQTKTSRGNEQAEAQKAKDKEK